LAAHYEQDSFLFTFPGQNRVAFLVATNVDGRSYFRNDIKFAGPLYTNVDNIDAWTECANGKIAFMLKGMIQKKVPRTKVWVGEGDVFDIDHYNPDYIIILHDDKNKDLHDSCERNKDLGCLHVELFDSSITKEEIKAKVKSALDTAPRNTQIIGFHCSISIDESYIEGARAAYDAVLEWAENTNNYLRKIVIVDIFGDYCKL
jgi:hypothetical protein